MQQSKLIRQTKSWGFGLGPIGAPEARPASWAKPEGRHAGSVAFSDGTRMCLPKIPATLAHPQRAARRARRRGGLSFGYFSLATQRKVTCAPAQHAFALSCFNFSAADSDTCCIATAESNSFRADARVTFLLWKRKVTKRNPPRRHAMRCAQGSQSAQEFLEGTSVCHPKTPRIVRDALRVYPPRLPCLKGINPGNNMSRADAA